MREGWSGDDYFVLFEERGPALQEAYGLSQYLPRHQLVGLKGWDDFIVKDERGEVFTVPTVPIAYEYVARLPIVSTASELRADPRLTGLVKWHVQPLVFGGSPELGPNVTWISVDKHVELVRWWNQKYRELKASET